jgi:glutamate synthase (NADH)
MAPARHLDEYPAADANIPLVPEIAESSFIDSFDAVQRDPESWSGALPASQGLYQNDFEKDACGVGFICHIKGNASHKIVSDARQLLCAMTHRGATGADSRDGDGAGVMTAIPHHLFKREAERDIGCTLPEPGEYAVGNVFFKPNDPVELQKQQAVFTQLAKDHGLRVLGWREVPTDGTILGPAASSKEPTILQPFVVLRAHYGEGNASQGSYFDSKQFERQLYVLRKHATHTMFVILSYQFHSMLKPCDYQLSARWQKVSMYAHCRRRTSFTRVNCRHRKCTTTTMI